MAGAFVFEFLPTCEASGEIDVDGEANWVVREVADK